MQQLSAENTGYKGFALVRDKHGRPKIDNYKTCPQEIKDMLTTEEQEEFENGINTFNSGS